MATLICDDCMVEVARKSSTQKRCGVCAKLRRKAYQQSPERKAYKKAYQRIYQQLRDSPFTPGTLPEGVKEPLLELMINVVIVEEFFKGKLKAHDLRRRIQAIEEKSGQGATLRQDWVLQGLNQL